MLLAFFRRHPLVFVSGMLSLGVAAPVGAVPPPDFIINVGTQVAQFFSLALLFTTAIASSLYQSFQVRFPSGVSRRKFWIGAAVFILAVSAVGATVFGRVLQERRLAQILAEPAMQRPEDPEVFSTTTIERLPLVTVPVPVMEAPTTSATVPVVPVTRTTSTASLPLMLTNQRLATILQDLETPYLILDAREDIEHEYGNFPGSMHIRYADLKAGAWRELPTDRPIIVLCWSGIRGKEVAAFLRTQQVQASYLEDGATGWVAFGGRWQGSIKFSDRYPDKTYAVLFSREEMQRRVQGGAVLVDAREPKERLAKPLAGALPISLLSTPTSDLSLAFAAVPEGVPVITVCGGYVDCFEAKIVGVELERRGHRFLGRYDVVL